MPANGGATSRRGLTSRMAIPFSTMLFALRTALAAGIETLGGAWCLLRLLAHSKFRLNGPYWRWRHETAFGRGEPPLREKRRAILHYARWMWRMRRRG